MRNYIFGGLLFVVFAVDQILGTTLRGSGATATHSSGISK